MIPYLFLLAEIFLVAAIAKPNENVNGKKVFYAIVFGTMIVIAAVRASTIGSDTPAYCRTYIQIGASSFERPEEFRFEYGFVLFCKLLYMLSSNSRILIMVTSFLIIGSTAVFFYRMSNHHAASAFLFVCLCRYFTYMNIMRQALAIAIILIALPGLLKRGKWLIFVACTLIAAQFHQSAYIALILVPLMKMPFNKAAIVPYAILIVALIMDTVFFTANIASLLGRDTFYGGKNINPNYFGGLLGVLFACFLVCICMYSIQKAGREGRDIFDSFSVNTDLMLHMLMLYVVFSVFGMKMIVAGRFAHYFNVLLPIVLPAALSVVKGRRGTYVRAGVYTIVFAFFLVICIFRPYWTMTVPYVADFSSILSLLS